MSTTTITWGTTFQTIDGFGACDWNSSENLTQAQANMFFGTGTGQVGFSLLRTLINEECGHPTVPSVPDDLGTLQKAVAAGVQLWGTVQSPPVSMKDSGSCASGNLLSGSYAAFATYIFQWAQMYKNNGIPLYAISFVNEPDVAISGTGNNIGGYAFGSSESLSQAGMLNFVKNNLGPTFAGNTLGPGGTAVRLAGDDDGQWAQKFVLMNSVMGDATAKSFISILAGHGYQYFNPPFNSSGPGGAPDGFGTGACCSPATAAPFSTATGQLWQSEVNGAANASVFDGSIGNGLVFARQIHDYLTVANATAWHHWMMLGPTFANDNEGLTDQSGNPAKRMYVMGNYSRFVRPGMVRISASSPGVTGVSVSAYKNVSTGAFAVVAINANSTSQPLTITLSGAAANTITPFITDGGSNNLAQQSPITGSLNSFNATLNSNSVTTFTGTISTTPSNTYYIDFKNGNNANNGTSKNTPWKDAPRMNLATSGGPTTVVLNPGDNVIFKGCVTWPSGEFKGANNTFSWNPKGGSSGKPIYYGVDHTWWDTTGTTQPSCSSQWNRPVFDAGGAAAPFQANGDPRMVHPNSFVTIDDIEFVNYYADGGGPKNTAGNNGGYIAIDQGTSGIIISNCYFHATIEPFFTMGTGNVAANSNTITNFVPFTYCQAPNPAWLSQINPKDNITVGMFGFTAAGSSNNVTSITNTGGNTWTLGTTMPTKATGCTGCTVQIDHADGLSIINGNGGTTGDGTELNADKVLNCYFDGSDNNIVALNPNADCGVLSGNNNMCASGMAVMFRQPPVWRNNFMQFISTGGVGDCSEFSGNTIIHMRGPANENAHTNIWESTEADPINGGVLVFNNLVHQTNVQNAATPTGQFTISQPLCFSGNGTSPLFEFNNVIFDTIQNYSLDRCSPNNNVSYVFNNTQDGGPNGHFNYGCANGFNVGDIAQNNLCVTNSTTPWSLDSTGNQVATTTSQLYTPTQATSFGLTPTQTFAYSPSSGNPLLGAGTSISSICSKVSAINAAAGAACLQDTTYGVAVDTVNHRVLGPARQTNSRPATPSIGAYELPSTGVATLTVSPNAVAFGNVNVESTVNGPTMTATNTGTVTLTGLFTNQVLSDTTDYAIINNTCGSTLGAGASCTFAVSFTPETAGSLPATLTFQTNANNSPTTVPITGTGIAPLVGISPPNFNFGNSVVNTPTAAQTFTLSNTGTAALSVTVSTITGAAGASFSLSNGTCGAAPFTVPINGSCTVSVTFDPPSTGNMVAALSFTSNSQTSPDTAALTGTGVAASALVLTPTTFNFGNLILGESSGGAVFTVNNPNSNTINLTGFSISGSNPGDFIITQNFCGASLASNASCNLIVDFAPTVVGSRSGSLTITNSGAGTLSAALSGTGVPVPPAQTNSGIGVF